MFDLMKKLLYWFLVLSALGVMGCAHNSKSSFDVPGIANGHLNVDAKLSVPMLGGSPAMTRAEVEAMIEKKLSNS